MFDTFNNQHALLVILKINFIKCFIGLANWIISI